MGDDTPPSKVVPGIILAAVVVFLILAVLMGVPAAKNLGGSLWPGGGEEKSAGHAARLTEDLGSLEFSIGRSAEGPTVTVVSFETTKPVNQIRYSYTARGAKKFPPVKFTPRTKGNVGALILPARAGERFTVTITLVPADGSPPGKISFEMTA
jgi:hypothetical protein